MVGYYGFTFDVHVCVHRSVSYPSIFSFLDNNLSKCQWFSQNLVCAVILWRPGLGLLMGKFCQFLSELSSRPGVLSFHVSIMYLNVCFRYSGNVRHIKIEKNSEGMFFMSDTRYFHSLPVSKWIIRKTLQFIYVNVNKEP